MKSLRQKPSALQAWVLPIASITLFFCLKFLFIRNMGLVNEIHHLPLSRHFAEPTWLAQDIYYSEPPGYRLLFQILFGHLTTTVGFLATSIIGRILGYVSVAVGLWTLARRLGIGLLTLLVAIGLFVYVRRPQGVIAGEWLLGGIEPKVFAYSALFMALSAMIAARYLWMTAWLGVAASFHALVGGWASIAVLLWLVWRRWDALRDVRRWLTAIAIYALTSIFVLTAVLTQLLSPVEESSISPAYIYSFLRNPHHVNPLAWPMDEWWLLFAYLLVFGSCAFYLLRALPQDAKAAELIRNQTDFFCYVLCTLVLFGAGILIAPLDRSGQILQYYPFRVGDLMLALGAALFLALTLEKLLWRHRRGAIAITLIILMAFGVEATRFYSEGMALRVFPIGANGVNDEMVPLADWLKHNVPDGEIVISSPVKVAALPWLSDHPSVAKFRFVPSASSADVEAWYERMRDLGGGIELLDSVNRRTDPRRPIRRILTEAYNNLNTDQAITLMDKYQSHYMVTIAQQQLELPVVYENPRYRVYALNKNTQR